MLDIFGNKKSSRKGRGERRGRKRESVRRSAISGSFAVSASFARPILIKWALLISEKVYYDDCKPIILRSAKMKFLQMLNFQFSTPE
jgi:hypothetical protein